MEKYLHNAWTRSRAFRAVLIVALGYAVLRLAVHGAYLTMMLLPEAGVMGGVPEWAGAEDEPMVPVDLQIYLDAAQRFRARQPLYLRSNRIEIYQYPPLYALAFTAFLSLPSIATVIMHSLLHVAAYVLLYVSWDQIFRYLRFDRVRQMLTWTLPVWLVFSSFWSDLGYLNIYVITALLGTLFIATLVRGRMGWSVLLLALILQIKPHWAFAAALPLLMGRYRFFLKLVGLTAIASAIVVGSAMLIAGPAYVCNQHVDYLRFLPHLVEDFPWRGPDSGFLGYNHSLKQINFYLLGVSTKSRRLATGIKILLLAPLGMVGLRSMAQASETPLYPSPKATLDLVFVLYLGALIWLDMVWEASLAVAVFPYLLATVHQTLTRILISAVFLPYALIDVWQLSSLGLFGMDVIAPGPYVLTDPSIYIPIVMLVVIVFYLVLLKRLWIATSTRWEVNIC